MSVTHYRMGGTPKIVRFGEDITDVEGWARDKLSGMAFRDSDHGYSEYIEFFHADGSRTYALANYLSFHPSYGEDGGCMDEFVYGDFDTVDSFGYIEAYQYDPQRDWIIL